MATKMYKCQRGLKLPATIQTNHVWVEVNNHSSSELKELLYTFAKCFTKEFDFGSAYCYPFDNHSSYQAFLFIQEGKLIGGCAFHALKLGEECSMPKLEWVWLIRSQRRQGHFQKLWDSFTSDLEKLAIGCPIEESMQAFIKKQTNWQVVYQGDLADESGYVFLERTRERS